MTTRAPQLTPPLPADTLRRISGLTSAGLGPYMRRLSRFWLCHSPRTAGLLGVFTVVTICLVAALAGGTVVAEVSSPDVFIPTRLAPSDIRGNMDATVSGDRVVWRYWDEVDSDYEVFTWTPAEGAVQLTSNTHDDDLPQVSGDRVVWKGSDGTDYEIFTWTPADGAVQLTSNAYDDDLPQVSGDRVVWKGSDGTDYEIFTWTPADGAVQLTSNAYDDDLPQVSGDRVVWKGSDGTDYEVFTWTPGDGVVRLTSNAYDDDLPQVSGDRVVWKGSDGTDYEIFTWTPADGAVQLTSDDTNDEEPQVSGDRVAWYAKRGYDGEVFTWQEGDASVTQLTDDGNTQEDVHVSGNRLVWKGWDGGDREIYTQMIGENAVKVTNNSFDDYDPQVDGDRLTWFADDAWGGTSGVYTAMPSALVVTGLSPDSGNANGGNEVVITGRGFAGATAVVFGTQEAEFTIDSDTQIRATAPWLTANVTVRVKVITPSDESPDNDYDDYLYEPDVVKDVFWITQVTFDAQEDEEPQVSADRVVWAAFDGVDSEIYTWALGDVTPTQVTDNSYDDTAPQVSGDRLAWMGWVDDDSEVFTQMVGDAGAEEAPDVGLQEELVMVSGDRLVWQAWDGTDYEVFTWVVGDPLPDQVTDNDYDDCSPQVDGDRVVWMAWDEEDSEIFTSVIGVNGPTKLTDDEFDDIDPVIAGDRLAWCGYDKNGFDQEIFTWTPTGGKVQITDDDVIQSSPRVCEECLVWEGFDTASASYQIFGWSPGCGILLLSDPERHWDPSSPDITYRRAVWACNGHGNLQTWTPSGGLVEIDTEGVMAAMPRASEQLIVWRGLDPVDGHWDIYVATLAHLSVDSVEPNNGGVEGGTEVTIRGRGFSDVSAVTFGGRMASEYNVVSDSEITATAPEASGAGAVHVLVETAEALSPESDNNIFTYYTVAPTVTGIVPSMGPTSGGTRVVISGADFLAVTGVTFGDTPATEYTVYSDTEIAATAPEHSPGNAQLRVFAGGGISAESEMSIFEYLGPPAITSLTPSGGECGGGTPVVIAGTGFVDVVGVSFGSARCSSFQVDSDTQITAVAPSWGWGGRVQVQVTAAGGASAYTVAADYMYAPPVFLEEYEITKLDLRPVEQFFPQVDGKRVVWQSYEGEDFEIMTYTPETGAIALTNNRRNDMDPQVSGDRVVWRGHDGQDYEIYTWTPSEGAVRLTDDSFNDSDVQISGDRIVWVGKDLTGDEYEIHTWTPSEGVTTLPTDEEYNVMPQVSGDRVVWASFEDGVFEVYTWTPTGGVVQVSDDECLGYAPQVSGDRIVWWGTDTAGNDRQVFTWTPEGGQMQLTTTYLDSYSPQVSGDRIVWYQWDEHDYDIMTWTPAEGAVRLTATECDETNPQVSGDRIVWQSYDGHDYEIATWSPTGGFVKLTDTLFRDLYPQVDGHRVVWQGMDPSARYFEICMAIPVEPLVTDMTQEYGDTGGGETISLTGSSFIGVEAVNFGDVPATGYEVISPLEMRVTTPPHAGGTVEVEVMAAGGSSIGGGSTLDFTYLGENRAEQNDVRITYMGSWSDVVDDSASGGSYTNTVSKGAGVLVEFKGTGLQILGTTGRWCGIGYVSVDGAAEVPVDFYSAVTADQQTVYDTGALPAGEHTVYLRCSGTSNSSSAGVSIDVDALRIVGGLMQATGVVSYQQDDLKIKYTDGWGTGWSWSASGFSFAQSDAPGSAINVAFEGNRLAWYAKIGPDYGKARVSLDGGDPVEIDLYSPTVLYKQPVYQTGMLGDGVHSLSIYCAGEKNTRSTGCCISADRFDVIGALVAAGDFSPVTITYQQSDSRLTYMGNWRESFSWSASGYTLFATDSPGAAVIAQYTGTSFKMIAKTDAYQGMAKVIVDGGPAQVVDLYTASTRYQQQVFDSGALDYGVHTVSISRAGARNTSSGGFSVNVDALQIAGSLEKAPSVTRYQQGDPRLEYSGEWHTSWTWWLASNCTYVCGYTEGAKVTVDFTGTYLAWVATTGRTYGMARVTLDGGPPVVVDLFSWSTRYKQAVYNTGLVADGEHTLTIEWLGQKNSNAWFHQIDVDAFDILGTL